MNDSAQIIQQLQELSAYQQHELNSLSEEFYKQQQELRLLQKQFQQLYARFKSLEDNVGDVITDQKPPHY